MHGRQASTQAAKRCRAGTDARSDPAQIAGTKACPMSAPPIEHLYIPIPRPALAAPTTGPVAMAAKSRARAARRTSA